LLAYFICFIGFLICVPASAAKITENGNVVYFDGYIDHDAYVELRRHLHGGARSIVVRSPGGSAKFGQLIGQEIARREISVTVDKYCLSACANYVFLAAQNKRLLPGAILGFHGSGIMRVDGTALGLDTSGAEASPLHDLEELSRRDVEFFRSIHVDHALFKRSSELTSLGKRIITYVVTDKKNIAKRFDEDQEAAALQYMDALMKSGDFLSFDASFQTMSDTRFYFPSKKKLIDYGVKGISEYPYPQNQTDLGVLAKEVDESLQVFGDF